MNAVLCPKCRMAWEYNPTPDGPRVLTIRCTCGERFEPGEMVVLPIMPSQSIKITREKIPSCDCDQIGNRDIRAHAQDCRWRVWREREESLAAFAPDAPKVVYGWCDGGTCNPDQLREIKVDPPSEMPSCTNCGSTRVNIQTKAARPGDQPLPIKSSSPHMHDLVCEDMQGRKALGTTRYGQPLQAHNGRDALRDHYEELLDACAYARQLLYERDGR